MRSTTDHPDLTSTDRTGRDTGKTRMPRATGAGKGGGSGQPKPKRPRKPAPSAATETKPTPKTARAGSARGPGLRTGEGPSDRMDVSVELKVPTHDEIAARAYQFYLERGCEDGHAEADWIRAERELLSR